MTAVENITEDLPLDTLMKGSEIKLKEVKPVLEITKELLEEELTVSNKVSKHELVADDETEDVKEQVGSCKSPATPTCASSLSKKGLSPSKLQLYTMTQMNPKMNENPQLPQPRATPTLRSMPLEMEEEVQTVYESKTPEEEEKSLNRLEKNQESIAVEIRLKTPKDFGVELAVKSQS